MSDNNGETGFDNDEPFICDICMEEFTEMYELDGIQVCKGCYKQESA